MASSSSSLSLSCDGNQCNSCNCQSNHHTNKCNSITTCQEDVELAVNLVHQIESSLKEKSNLELASLVGQLQNLRLRHHCDLFHRLDLQVPEKCNDSQCDRIHWDRDISDYFRHMYNAKISYSLVTTDFLTKICDAFRKHHVSSILEVGAGRGYWSSLFAKSGSKDFQVITTDINSVEYWFGSQQGSFVTIREKPAVEAIQDYPECDVIFCSWPSPLDKDYLNEVIKMLPKGKLLALVGSAIIDETFSQEQLNELGQWDLLEYIPNDIMWEFPPNDESNEEYLHPRGYLEFFQLLRKP